MQPNAPRADPYTPSTQIIEILQTPRGSCDNEDPVAATRSLIPFCNRIYSSALYGTCIPVWLTLSSLNSTTTTLILARIIIHCEWVGACVYSLFLSLVSSVWHLTLILLLLWIIIYGFFFFFWNKGLMGKCCNWCHTLLFEEIDLLYIFFFIIFRDGQ